mgnify:CR=1 FL=1
MIEIHQLLKKATILLNNISDTPQLDAEILLADVLKKPRNYLYAWPEKKLSNSVQQHFLRVLKRRLMREPIAYIRGQVEFWSLSLDVTNTLIPRPETECLVELILEYAGQGTRRLADLGTGSGAIALAIASERIHWEIVATDINEAALVTAQQNAARLGLDHIHFKRGDWCQALSDTFDFIVSNPPYIGKREWPKYAENLAYEPKEALLSGPDGLNDIKKIVASACNFLKPDGLLFLEHGSHQGPAVRDILMAAQLIEVQTCKDLSNHERVTFGKNPSFR